MFFVGNVQSQGILERNIKINKSRKFKHHRYSEYASQINE